MNTEQVPLLLYDGTCGFCAGSVRLILRFERRRRTLRFAPLQGAAAAAVRARHPQLADLDTMVWVEPARGSGSERVLVRSDAALAIAAYLGGPWAAARVARIVPKAIRDATYAFVARHRHRLPGADTCVLPGDRDRARFLN